MTKPITHYETIMIQTLQSGFSKTPVNYLFMLSISDLMKEYIYPNDESYVMRSHNNAAELIANYIDNSIVNNPHVYNASEKLQAASNLVLQNILNVTSSKGFNTSGDFAHLCQAIVNHAPPGFEEKINAIQAHLQEEQSSNTWRFR